MSLKISLSFLTLNIPSCEENYLEIYDGSSDNTSTLLAKFCDENATSGARVVSEVNSLYIVLKSGNNSARNTEDSSKGLEFYAKYEAFQQGTVKLFFLYIKIKEYITFNEIHVINSVNVRIYGMSISFISVND